ncbi:MAG: hypothetical protein GWP08_10595 [Nitrospiraceae bacterium]|nr:hypothetical protein [Nitrospiraceae bacterium]
MKSGTIVVMLAAMIVVAGIVYSFTQARERPVRKEALATPPPAVLSEAVHVDDLAKDPGRFAGNIVLEGVVAGVSQSDGVFGVIDSREYAECGELDCTDNLLPVKADGELPSLATLVRVTGRIVQSEKGLVFEASRLEKSP